MAFQVTATKGGLSITSGYLVITLIQIQKYLRPDTVTDTIDNGDGTTSDVPRVVMVNDTLYTARGQIYPSQVAREKNFGATDLNFAFHFPHAAGRDSAEEAYEYIAANGLAGYTLTGLTPV